MNTRLPAWLVKMTLPLVGLAVPLSYADESTEVTMYEVTSEGQGDAVGTVSFQDDKHGLLIELSLEQLSPGLHGFHVHENPDCSPGEKDGEMAAAVAAGGHFDPDNTGAHRGPYDSGGHLGDLPALYVDQDGESSHLLLAPRLEVTDLAGRALVIHKGGDNYSDEPKPLGGGESRIACGVLSEE